MKLNIVTEPSTNIPMVTASSEREAPPASLLELLTLYHAELMAELHQKGAILFRGFGCLDADHFSQAVELCGLGERCSTRDYDLPRTLLANDIYTSCDLPSHIPLPLHHEKPRSKNPPTHIYFCCITPPAKGGGTIFANALDIWLNMPREIQKKIIKHGVLYQQFFHGKSLKYHWLKKILGQHCAQGWPDYFGTTDKTTVEKRLMQDEVTWEWVNPCHDLILSSYLPGVLHHPLSNQIAWFNSSAYLNYYSNMIYNGLKASHFWKYAAYRYLILKDMFPIVCHYGDGQAFSPGEVKEINRVIENHACVLNWQKGDFMIVDNFTFMHGKEAHQGERLLYSCMTALHTP